MRSRKLRFEFLESRLALTAVSVPLDAITLEQYLAVPPEMGPVADQAAIASVSTAPFEAVVEQLAVNSPSPVGASEAEGEGPLLPLPPLPPLPLPPVLPSLVTFSADRTDGGWVRLSGSISSPVAGTPISFGGLLTGYLTVTDAAGNFQLFIADPGTSGFVTANVLGNATILSDYLD